MWVGVDEVGGKDLFEIGVVESPGYLSPANPRRFDGLIVCYLDIGYVFQGEDTPGRIVPVDIGNANSCIIGEVSLEPFGVLPLGHKIQLSAGSSRELVK